MANDSRASASNCTVEIWPTIKLNNVTNANATPPKVNTKSRRRLGCAIFALSLLRFTARSLDHSYPMLHPIHHFITHHLWA
jgi:hypothetical protein